MVEVAETEQVVRVVVVMECRVRGKPEEVPDTVELLEWRWCDGGPYWSSSVGGCGAKSERA